MSSSNLNTLRKPEEIFDLKEKIGEGSYGTVHRAIVKETGQIVAVKKIPVEAELDDILREISIMNSCDSRYITKYYHTYFHQAYTELWISMEFCGAGSVSDMIKIRKMGLTEKSICVILADILKGLEYLHARKRIHRDIKAGNILLTEDGHSKLADFGVAGQLTDTIAKRNTMTGTPFWMAPEVVSSKKGGYGCLADIWSLGISIIEMAECKPPLSQEHPMKAILLIPERPSPVFEHPQKWSNNFNHFLACCLQKHGKERWPAHKLLKHDFILKVENDGSYKQELLSIIEECQRLRAERKNRPKQQNQFGYQAPQEVENLQDNFQKVHLSPNQNNIMQNMNNNNNDFSDNREISDDHVDLSNLQNISTNNTFQQINPENTLSYCNENHNKFSLPNQSNNNTNPNLNSNTHGTAMNSFVFNTGIQATDTNTTNQPDFMAYFDEKEQEFKNEHLKNLLIPEEKLRDDNERNLQNLILGGYTEKSLSDLSEAEIEGLLGSLDQLMERNLGYVEERYNQRRAPIQAALEALGYPTT